MQPSNHQCHVRQADMRFANAEDMLVGPMLPTKSSERDQDLTDMAGGFAGRSTASRASPPGQKR